MLFTCILSKAAEVSKPTFLFVWNVNGQILFVGMRVNAWVLGGGGLMYDRHFALVDSVSGKTITQKMFPVLSLVTPRIDLNRGVMVVSGPGVTEVWCCL